VRQQQLAGQVPDGAHAGDVGAHLPIHRHETALVQLHAQCLEPQVPEVGSKTHGNQCQLGLHALLAVLIRECNARAAPGLFNRKHFGSGVHLHAALAQSLGQFGRSFVIFRRQNVRKHLHQVHLHSIRAPDGGKFHTNCAAADDERRFWQLLQHNRVGIIQDFFAVRFHPGHYRRMRAGRQDDVSGADYLAAAVACVHLYF